MNQTNESKPNKFVSNIFGDSYLPSINGKKFEEIAYSTYFDIDILAQLSKEFTFYIFIGTDSGMLLKHLQLLNTDPGSTYLFIEDSKIIQQINKHILDIKQSNILISTIDNWQNDSKKADIIKYIEVNRIQAIKSFSAQEQTYLPYTTIAQTLHDEINQLKWIHPDKFQKKIYIQRQIENCSENFNPAIKLKNLLQGKPALILAGGPSLDDYIDWIEENQQYYVVIAVSRIARRLLSTQIIPDIFVTADPFDSAFTTSKEVLAFGEKSILVHQAYAHPKLIGQWQGEQFYLGDLLPWKSDYQPENIKGVGPTVTNCAIHLAIQMGIIDQLLFGADLCYSKEGFSHVSGTMEHESGADLGFTGVSIFTNDNKSALTTYEHSEARTSISLLAELVHKQGGIIINPAPDAAAIDNVFHQSLETIQIPENKIDINILINKQLKKSKSEEQLLHYSKLLDEHNSLITQAEKVLSYAQEIIYIASENYDEKNKTIHSETSDAISIIENKLNKYKSIIVTIENFGVNGFVDFTHPEKIINPNNELNIIAQYYNSLFIATDLFIHFINSSIKRISIRTMELSTPSAAQQANINKLLSQWGQDNDKQFGRILLVRQNNPELYKKITPAKKKKYHKIFKQYFNISNKKQSSIKTQAIRLEGLEVKFYDFFQKNNKDNLSQIIHQISPYNNEQSISLTHLAHGYLFELNGEVDHAINSYLNASHHQTLESGLKRILDITLKNGDIENTITVLHALSNISAYYLIQLANLYHISEQYKDALDTYSKYIDTNPKDILILIKMGLLYISLDILDGAEFIFKHILEIDCNNQTAVAYLNKTKLRLSAHKTINLSLSTNNIIVFTKDKSIEINEYFFYKSFNKKTIDTKRLQKAQKKNSIAFIATDENLKNNAYINYINKLCSRIKNIRLTIFIFNTKQKPAIISLFKDNKDILQFIVPNNIFDIVENVEIYLSVRETTDIYIKNIFNIIRYNCKNIFAINFSNALESETLEAAEERMKNSIIMKNYKKVGFTDKDIQKNGRNYHKILYTKALDYQCKLMHTTNSRQELTHFDAVKWALSNKTFIYYFYNFHRKIFKLHEISINSYNLNLYTNSNK